jgi:drug/metabolite transporter (DMT)-like permease
MSRPSALLALHFAVALFGFAGLFGKWLALPPVGIVFGRTLVAAAALAVIARLRTERGAPTLALAVNGAILALHWVTFFQAIQVANVAIGLLGFASFPLFVLLLERRVDRARRSGRTWLAGALVTAGLVVLVPAFAWQDRTVQGLLWGLLSGFTFALLAVRGRALVERQSATSIALWQNAFAALLLLPVVAASGTFARPPTAGELGLILVLGVVCTALAHTLFIASMTRVTAHVASVVAGLEPVYGIALAALLLREVPDARTLAGAVLIVGAAIIATRTPVQSP